MPTQPPNDQETIARLSSDKRVLAKQNRTLLAELSQARAINETLGKRITVPLPKKIRTAVKSQKGIELEFLVSDLHIGKRLEPPRGEPYNEAVAVKRLDQYADFICGHIHRVKPERAVILLLGDWIEHSTRQGSDSFYGSLTSTQEQVAAAIQAVSSFTNKIVHAAADVGAGLYFPCVAGNHENDDRGIRCSFPGRTSWTWPIYTTLKFQYRKHRRAEFNITTGSFMTYKIGGQQAVCEHGAKVNPSCMNLYKQIAKRREQTGENLRRFRMGDKHTLITVDNAKLVVNGAFFSDNFGQDFSGVHALSSQPCQAGFAYDRDGVSEHLICRF